MVRRGDGVCISISFNFCAWYRVEIRFNDNRQQKNTIDHIIWLRRKKCVIYRLDIIFIMTQVVQLMVSEINLFCQMDICRYPWISKKRYQTSYHVRKMKNGNGWLFLCDTWLRYMKKLHFMLMETRQISNLRSQDVSKKILSNLARENVAEFSEKFFHF